MKLYCLDIFAIGMVVVVLGNIVIGKALEKDTKEEQILKAGYKKTELTYNQLLYSNYHECIEPKNKFYCY